MESSVKERKKLHRWEQKNRWMPHYELKYGVQPIEFGPPPPLSASALAAAGRAIANGAAHAAAAAQEAEPTVIKAKCRFCECFGREPAVSRAVVAVDTPSTLSSGEESGVHAAMKSGELAFPTSPRIADALSGGGGALSLEPGSGSGSGGCSSVVQPPHKKRKKRQTLKVFGPNFRTDNLESHLSREHPARWKEYDRLRDNAKKAFFPDVAEAKEAMLAQHAAAEEAVAATTAAMSTGVLAGQRFGPSGGGLANGAMPSSFGGVAVGPSSFMASMMDKIGSASMRFLVSTEVMEMVEQLLASRYLKLTHAPVSSPNGTTPTNTVTTGNTCGNGGVSASSSNTSALLNAWQQFVRDDERSASEDATTPSLPLETATTTSFMTGECRAVGNDFCTISVKKEALFYYIVDALNANLSLDSVLAMVHALQRVVPDADAVLTSTSREDIAHAVHQMVALNLSCISQLMAFSWGYSLFLRFVTEHSTGFVDIRLQVAVDDQIQDLHVISIPLEAQKHSTETLGSIIVKVLTTLEGRAMTKVIGVTVDGDPHHMTQYQGIGRWLKRYIEDATEVDTACYVLHSGAYHLSYIVDELLEHCQADFRFLTTLADLQTLCLGNEQLLSAMGPKPQRFPSAHWISTFNACEWLAIDRETIQKWCSENNSVDRLPSSQWWVVLFVLRDVLKDVLVAYHRCRDSCQSFADVQKHLRDLIFQVRLKFNIKPAMPPTETLPTSMAAGGNTVSSGEPGSHVGGGPTSGSISAAAAFAHGSSSMNVVGSTHSHPLDPCEFEYHDFVNAVIPLDLFMYKAFQLKSIDGIGDEERLELYRRFNLLWMLLINKILVVVNVSPDAASRTMTQPTDPNTAVASSTRSTSDTLSNGDSSDHTTVESSTDTTVDATTAVSTYRNSTIRQSNSLAELHQYAMDIPPSTPFEFITMNNLAFMELLNQQRSRIRSKWTGKVLSMITDDRNRMVSEFAQRGVLYDAVTLAVKQQESGNSQFRDAWKPFIVEFPSLASFAVVFGGLLSVTRTSEEELHRYHTMNISRVPNVVMEAQFHANQFFKVSALRRHTDSTVV